MPPLRCFAPDSSPTRGTGPESTGEAVQRSDRRQARDDRTPLLPRLLPAEDRGPGPLKPRLGPTGDPGLQSDRSRRTLPEEESRTRAEVHPDDPQGHRLLHSFPAKDHGWQGPNSWSLDLLQETSGANSANPPRRVGDLPVGQDVEELEGPPVRRGAPSAQRAHPPAPQPSDRGLGRRDGTDLPPTVGWSHLGSVRAPRPSPGDLPAARRSSLPDGGLRLLPQAVPGYLSSSKSGAGYVRFLRWVRGKYPSAGGSI